jgi:hypothetical protein
MEFGTVKHPAVFFLAGEKDGRVKPAKPIAFKAGTALCGTAPKSGGRRNHGT